MLQIKGILFDMDGVLIDSMPAHVQAWAQALGELGLGVDELELYRREGEKGEVSAKYFIRSAGMMSTKKRVSRLLELKEEIFGQKGKIKLFPGALETVRTVVDAGLKTGLVTGTSLAEVNQVLPEEIARSMDTIITGDQVLHGKPHPEPYLMAIMALGLKPGEVLVIENAPYGIDSAVKAGALCLAVRSYLPDRELAQAHYRIDQLKDLPEFLRRNLAGFV